MTGQGRDNRTAGAAGTDARPDAVAREAATAARSAAMSVSPDATATALQRLGDAIFRLAQSHSELAGGVRAELEARRDDGRAIRAIQRRQDERLNQIGEDLAGIKSRLKSRDDLRVAPEVSDLRVEQAKASAWRAGAAAVVAALATLGALAASLLGIGGAP